MTFSLLLLNFIIFFKGYGDIYPSTSYGQLFVVFYTSVGMPLHVLLFTMIGESFARSYQEIMIRVKGDQDAPLRRTLGYLGFFLPWIIVFYVLPSIAFIFMENWNFIDGVYYCFITLTTIGLGDYIAGNIFLKVFFYKDHPYGKHFQKQFEKRFQLNLYFSKLLLGICVKLITCIGYQNVQKKNRSLTPKKV